MNAPVMLPLPTTWTTGSTEVFKTGSWRAATPRHIQAPSPCHQACPVNGDVAHWIGLARAGDWHAAWQVLVQRNPFPAIAGRICHHPCEAACNRAGFDEALSICKLERFVGDQAIAGGWRIEPPAQQRAGHVAVVGAGPAGLAAAYQLRRQGWRVTVFEASSQAGGLMRHGIPAYRLPRAVLDAEIGRILALGVELRCNQPLRDAAQLQQLRESHDAVFVATGAALVKRLPGLDYGLPGVLDGAAYLAAANAGAPPALGPSVLVIGGGSAAFDAARSARRAGHSVGVLALESRAQLPAQREEVEEAIEEGVALIESAMLLAAQADASGLRLRCTRVRFVPGQRRGEFSVQPTAGSEFELGADALLVSIGQDADLSILGEPLRAPGDLLPVDSQAATAQPGMWAGGDLTSLERYVTAAVAMGQRAAQAIHRALLGEPIAQPEGPALAVGLASIALAHYARAPRAQAPRRFPSERHSGTLEVQLPLELQQALAESGRCFSCGHCTECDNCIIVCPDLAVRRADACTDAGAGAYEVLGDYCKGCGLCVRECPTGSMTMLEDRR